MEILEFKDFLFKKLNDNKININLSKNQINEIYKYMKYILETNKFINLTAIKDEKEFIIKHIIDSLYIQKYVEIFKDEYVFDIEEYIESENLNKKAAEELKNAKIKYLDLGTGGGFPLSIVNILNEDILSYGLDSTRKKLKVIEDSNLNINTIHGRAEILAHENEYREQFYICSSRAVSNLNNIIELMAGFVMPSGYLICMKGEQEPLNEKLVDKLSLELTHIEEYNIEDAKRTIYIFKKLDNLNSNYPNKNSKNYSKKSKNKDKNFNSNSEYKTKNKKKKK